LSEIICDTSPIQYLHQIGQLTLLSRLAGNVIVPPYVVQELEMGRNLGVNLPNIRALNWIAVRTPLSVAALPLVKDLGPGETQVLALALELSNLSAFFNFIRTNIDQDFQNPCDNPMLRKMIKAKPMTSWDVIEKDLIDEIIFKTEKPQKNQGTASYWN